MNSCEYILTNDDDPSRKRRETIFSLNPMAVESLKAAADLWSDHKIWHKLLYAERLIAVT